MMECSRVVRLAVVVTSVILCLTVAFSAACASTGVLQCGPFTRETVPVAAPQSDPEATQRYEAIVQEVRSGRRHEILFLGDSLTQKWDASSWDRYFAPAGALNAGVNGDRTEHLLWRLAHGTLDGQEPRAVVLLIGTNDIGRNRPPATVAEGIRANLMLLRARIPAAPILLLAVLPRGESPKFWRRRQVQAVNALIRSCADGRHIRYLDLADVLLDSHGVLTRAMSPDGVHLSEQAYSRLASRLAAELDRMLAQE
jgi:lysophospholipase L1-like esterase